MSLRHLVPSLALALAIPAAAQAMTWEDGPLELSLGLRIQSRIELASAEQGDNTVDIWEGEVYADGSDTEPQMLNFMFRRIRVKMAGSYGDNWGFYLDLDADKYGSKNSDDPAVDVNCVGISYEIAADDITHTISFAYDTLPLIPGVFDSSSKLAFATTRATSHTQGLAGETLMHLGYNLSHPMFGLDIALGEAENDANENNNWVFGARLSTSLDPEQAVGKRQESYLGNEGFGHEAGLTLALESYEVDANDGGMDSAFVLGLDYLIHMNELTGSFDFTYRNQGQGDGADDLTSMVLGLQVAYAMVQEDEMVYEPVARLWYIDQDTEADEETVYAGEGGESGLYISLGVNSYINGHKNKIHAGFEYFMQEDGTDAEVGGDAFILRVQHQLDF